MVGEYICMCLSSRKKKQMLTITITKIPTAVLAEWKYFKGNSDGLEVGGHQFQGGKVRS